MRLTAANIPSATTAGKTSKTPAATLSEFTKRTCTGCVRLVPDSRHFPDVSVFHFQDVSVSFPIRFRVCHFPPDASCHARDISGCFCRLHVLAGRTRLIQQLGQTLTFVPDVRLKKVVKQRGLVSAQYCSVRTDFHVFSTFQVLRVGFGTSTFRAPAG